MNEQKVQLHGSWVYMNQCRVHVCGSRAQLSEHRYLGAEHVCMGKEHSCKGTHLSETITSVCSQATAVAKQVPLVLTVCINSNLVPREHIHATRI